MSDQAPPGYERLRQQAREAARHHPGRCNVGRDTGCDLCADAASDVWQRAMTEQSDEGQR